MPDSKRSREYMPLNGEEVRAAVIAEVTAALATQQDLAKHLAYPRVSWEWSVTIRPFHSDQGQIKAAGNGEHHERTNFGQRKKVKPGAPISIDSTHATAHPDDEREAAGISRDSYLEQEPDEERANEMVSRVPLE